MSKGVQASHDKWGLRGVAVNIALIVAVLALFQAYRTGSLRGITG